MLIQNFFYTKKLRENGKCPNKCCWGSLVKLPQAIRGYVLTNKSSELKCLGKKFSAVNYNEKKLYLPGEIFFVILKI